MFLWEEKEKNGLNQNQNDVLLKTLSKSKRVCWRNTRVNASNHTLKQTLRIVWSSAVDIVYYCCRCQTRRSRFVYMRVVECNKVQFASMCYRHPFEQLEWAWNRIERIRSGINCNGTNSPVCTLSMFAYSYLSTNNAKRKQWDTRMVQQTWAFHWSNHHFSIYFYSKCLRFPFWIDPIQWYDSECMLTFRKHTFMSTCRLWQSVFHLFKFNQMKKRNCKIFKSRAVNTFLHKYQR